MENRPQQIPFDADEFAPDVIGRYIAEHTELTDEFALIAYSTAHILVHQALYLPHEVENARLFYRYMFFPNRHIIVEEDLSPEDIKDLMENR